MPFIRKGSPRSFRRKMKDHRKTIGVIEPVIVKGKTGQVTVLAKIDTGAARTTVDMDIAARVGLGPVLDTVRVRAPMSKFPETRSVVDTDLIIAGEEFNLAAAITDRQEMRYHVIIGMDILSQGRFLVDPSRSAEEDGRGKFE